MLNVRIYSIGKIKNKNLQIEIEELKKRITRLELIELKEIKDKNIEIIKKKELYLFEKYISSNNHNILLWEFGKEFTTQELYNNLSKIEKDTCFFITGAFGPSEELKNKVNSHLSLSKMTFTHEQALYLLIEQLYRVECLKKGIAYNK